MEPPDAERYFLTTARLGFRAWRPDDVARAVALWGDPDVARFTHAGGPPSRAAIEERLTREIASQTEHGFQYWPVFLLDDATHAGCCGVRLYRPEQRILELGVHLLPAFWGRGLAVEAARAAIAYAFAELGAEALFAGHHPANEASRAMLHRLGFRYTHDELYPPDGVEPPVVFAEA